MPKLARQKVHLFPFPNLLGVLPQQFTETAKLRLKEDGVEPALNGQGAEAKATEGTHSNGDDTLSMEVDEIGSTIAETENGNPDVKAETKKEAQEVLPAPTEEEVVDFLTNRTKPNEGSSSSTVTPKEILQTKQLESSGASARAGSNKEKEWKEPKVFYIEETGEMFVDYEQYINRMMFYQQRIFAVDNHSSHTQIVPNTYFQALHTERINHDSAQALFPDVLKKPCLAAAQFSREGRLENLSDGIYNRFSKRFFPLEKLFVELGKDTYFANVISAVSSKNSPGGGSPGEFSSRASETSQSHSLAMDSSMDLANIDNFDNPLDYQYKVQLIRASDIERNKHFSLREDDFDRWTGKILNVTAAELSRDRTSWSKVAVKKFLKDSLEREAAICSPWTVNSILAKRYNIPTEIPEHVQKEVDAEREIQVEKRRTKWAIIKDPPEGSEEPPHKKQKTGKGSKKKGQTDQAASLAGEVEEEQAAELDAKNRRKKPTKFPAEDLLLELTYKEKAAERKERRPGFTQTLPFPNHFEMFLMSWNFLNSMSAVIKLSTFSIDEFENALYHSNPAQPGVLMQEIHQSLLNVIRNDAVIGQDFVLPLKAAVRAPEIDESVESEEEDEDTAEKLKLVVAQGNALATSFLDRETGGKGGRKDWEAMLVGCLWQRATDRTVPHLIQYMQGILLEGENTTTSRPTWSAASTRPRVTKNMSARYLALHSTFKLEMVAFLCELAMQTKLVRDHFDQAALALSRCRNDQNIAKRELAKIRGVPDKVEGENGTPDEQAHDEDGTVPPGSDIVMGSDEELSEDESEEGSTRGGRGKNNAVLRRKAIEAKQAQRDAESSARGAKAAKEKAKEKVKKTEAESEAKAVERIEELEREFRRQYNAHRTHALGQDRFCNTYWWLDGCGTANLASTDDTGYGTGRIYVQGPKQSDMIRLMEEEDFTADEIEERRGKEEPEDERLEEAEWAVIDGVEQVQQFLFWLNPKGKREGKLLKAIEPFRETIEASMHRREEIYAPEAEVEELGLTARRQKRHACKSIYRSKEVYIGYRNTLR